jgi:serine/threonine protein kinase
MVTGQVPFEGETPLSVAIKHKSEPPQDPRELNNQVSAAMSQIILKGLEKSREGRFQAAEELRDRLDTLEKGFPTKERMIVKKKPTTTHEVKDGIQCRSYIVTSYIAFVLFWAGPIAWTLRPSLRPSTTSSGHRPCAIALIT